MRYGTVQSPEELEAVGLPGPRGPLTGFLLEHLRRPPSAAPGSPAGRRPPLRRRRRPRHGRGRDRPPPGRGRAFLPASGSLLAPVWLLERSASSWLAVHARLFRGGASYAGGRLPRAAAPERVLHARVAARRAQAGGSVSGRRPANPVSGQCHHATAGSPSTQQSR
jgi:hypothetical protein